MASAQNNSGSYLTAARELAPRIATAVDEIDRERELPDELFAELADKGFFRLLVPRSLGGGEIDYLEHLSIVQTFAEVDGSTAWCINQNNVFATVSAKMPEPLAREIWGAPRAVVANGPPTNAFAIPVSGGYRLTGRWNFSSGCRHATWMAAVAPVKHPSHDTEPSRDKGEDRMLIMPKEQVNLVDVWQVNGLRGTGTFSFEVKDVFVPGERTFNPSDSPREEGPLYVMPMLLLFASGFACAALGVARSALNAAIELAGGKRPRLDRNLLRDKSVVQREIGKAEAIWGSARAFLLETAAAAWESACQVHALTLEERIRLRLASTHAIRMAAAVVDIAYEVCGSDSIFEHKLIQRRFQDAHVITQQIQGRMAHYETAGQFFLGLEPEGMF
jgi:alkylation response protein AidB-like acyl-CoA dehydrogenase